MQDKMIQQTEPCADARTYFFIFAPSPFNRLGLLNLKTLPFFLHHGLKASVIPTLA